LLGQLLDIKAKYKNLEIILEVTEKKFIQDFDKFQSFFSLIRDKGIKIALDDVGSGYSSLQYLIELNIDYFKIDMTLVQDIHKNYLKRSVVSALVDIAREKHAKVIAEGIEKVEELKVIREFGIDFGQGFLFARPSVRPIVNLQFED
ncbi:EAL domain-containing protein, partial [bacterium]|nr:EAL domain-containing protein [bacterium]